MYGRRLGAKVIPIVEIEKHGLSIGHESGATGDHTILIKIGLRNEGRGIAKYPYIFLENTEGLQHISNPTELPYNTRTKKSIGGIDHVIHPGTEIFGPNFYIKVQITRERLGNNEFEVNSCYVDRKFTIKYGAEGQFIESVYFLVNRNKIAELLRSQNKSIALREEVDYHG